MPLEFSQNLYFLIHLINLLNKAKHYLKNNDKENYYSYLVSICTIISTQVLQNQNDENKVNYYLSIKEEVELEALDYEEKVQDPDFQDNEKESKSESSETQDTDIWNKIYNSSGSNHFFREKSSKAFEKENLPHEKDKNSNLEMRYF